MHRLPWPNAITGNVGGGIGFSGSAHIFELDASGNWSIKQTLLASNAEPNDEFGYSVAISGNYAIVGAPTEDGTSTNSNFNCGAAYIFERDGSGNWLQTRILRASNLGQLDRFGDTVAISGTYAIVGARGEDGNSNNIADCGAAYIFERDGNGNWPQTRILRASNLETNDGFGRNSIAISGNYAIVGAIGEDGSGTSNLNCGAVYIFERDGGLWNQKPVLRASNFGLNDEFGVSVAIDGNYAIASAKFEDGSSNNIFNTGAVYIFERNIGGTWNQTQILRASNANVSDEFGTSVAISGNYAIIGAAADEGTTAVRSGSIYIFERNSGGTWIQVRMLTGRNPISSDAFGYSVAISGKYIMVGANMADGTNALNDRGQVYFYGGSILTISPTPLSFVGNTLTITNSIDATDTDGVSFPLASGAKLYPFRVTNFSGTGTVTYTLDISGGANVVSGTFSATNFDILKGSIITASGATTYIFTLTANAAITYTIVGKLLISPTNIISTPSSCFELKPIGTTIGTLTCDNLDNDLITYSVSDTANFSITGSTLRTNAIFDFERVPSYTITITALIGGLTSSNSRTISVTNISAEAIELRNQNLQGLALKTAAESQINPPITAGDLKAAGYTITELIQAGYTTSQLLSFISYVEFQESGMLPDWNLDASASHIIKSYVKDFVDVSGSVVLRNNANLYVHGNAQLGGNLSLNRPAIETDLSFNNRLFVGGDISMNGNVNIGGNISLTGSVVNCSNVANDSVPQSAFNGSVSSGPDYTAARVAYRQNFQVNDDVSMNGTNVQANNVKVNGNIVFSDGTIMNSYDNNILSTNPTVFKPSTFTSLAINGNLTAGSYSTSSDYRIKTKVAQLDKTVNVENLRPVKYVQTLINKTQYGLIAHELQEYYPDLVVGEKDGDGWQRVNYTGLIAILINEIKRMKQDLAELEGEN